MKMPGSLDLERLYDEHAQPLYAFLLNFTRDEADTRDLLQELFIKLARSPHLLASVREERAFLIRLAHNTARSTDRQTPTGFSAAIPLSSLARGFAFPSIARIWAVLAGQQAWSRNRR